MDISITRADMDDLPEILDLQKLAYQAEAIQYDDWSIPPLTQTLSEIQEAYAHSSFLKAVCDDRIVGSVRASLDKDTCKIGRLIVHPDFQRKGIGSLLMKSMETRFPDAKRFELFTGAKSSGNISLYQKLGYATYREQDLSRKVRIVYLEKYR